MKKQKIKNKIRCFCRFNSFVLFFTLAMSLYCSLFVDKLILRGSAENVRSALEIQRHASSLYLLVIFFFVFFNCYYFARLLMLIYGKVLLGNSKRMIMLCCLDVLKSASLVYYLLLLFNAYNHINWLECIMLVMCILLSSIIFPFYKKRFLVIIVFVFSLIPVVMFPLFLHFSIGWVIEKYTQAWQFQLYYHWYTVIEILIMLLLPISIVGEKLLGNIEFKLEENK